MLKTKIGHVTVVDSEELTTIIGITHGLAWEKFRSIIRTCTVTKLEDIRANKTL